MLRPAFGGAEMFLTLQHIIAPALTWLCLLLPNLTLLPACPPNIEVEFTIMLINIGILDIFGGKNTFCGTQWIRQTN